MFCPPPPPILGGPPQPSRVGAQVQPQTTTPPKHFGPLKGGWGGVGFWFWFCWAVRYWHASRLPHTLPVQSGHWRIPRRPYPAAPWSDVWCVRPPRAPWAPHAPRALAVCRASTGRVVPPCGGLCATMRWACATSGWDLPWLLDVESRVLPLAWWQGGGPTWRTPSCWVPAAAALSPQCWQGFGGRPPAPYAVQQSAVLLLSCCGVSAIVFLLSCFSLQSTPAPLPIYGLWGCSTPMLLSSCGLPAAVACRSYNSCCPFVACLLQRSAACFTCGYLAAAGSWLQISCSSFLQPPPNESRGYGGAAPATFLLQLSCSRISAAVLPQPQQLLFRRSMCAATLCNKSPPRYQSRGFGGAAI